MKEINYDDYGFSPASLLAGNAADIALCSEVCSKASGIASSELLQIVDSDNLFGAFADIPSRAEGKCILYNMHSFDNRWQANRSTNPLFIIF